MSRPVGMLTPTRVAELLDYATVYGEFDETTPIGANSSHGTKLGYGQQHAIIAYKKVLGQLPVDHPLPTDATKVPLEVHVNMEAPIKWSTRTFFRATPRHVGGIVLGFAPTFFAIGAELITGRSRGVALMIGPFWLGFAVASINEEQN